MRYDFDRPYFRGAAVTHIQGPVLVANPRQRSLAYLMIALAVGQAFFAIGLSWVASASSLKNLDDYQAKVELPLWFAILPTLTALGVSVHLRSSRHVDRSCPWISLGWLILAVNMLGLMLFMQMTL